MQWCTHFLFGIDGKKISDLWNFELKPNPVAIISIPEIKKEVQRTIFIVSEETYKVYEKSIFSILSKSEQELQYKILNNIFLSFENIAFTENNEKLSILHRSRLEDFDWFMEELTTPEDFFKENKIHFI